MATSTSPVNHHSARVRSPVNQCAPSAHSPAAFVFAAQMVNFPVIAGTSGHLIGGTLAAALLGPSAAILVLTTVLTVQCFAFADGGITALGANIFNMAIVGGVGGWMVYTALTRLAGSVRGRIVAAVVAAWASTVFAAVVLFLNAVFNVFAWPRFFSRVRADDRARDAAGRATPFLIVHAVLLGVALLLAVLSAVAGVLLLVA